MHCIGSQPLRRDQCTPVNIGSPARIAAEAAICFAGTIGTNSVMDDGSLFLVDRVKRIIIRYDGFKVLPSQIERTISGHPSVRGCCVVGFPDPEHAQGKLPAAFVVLNPSLADRSEEIIAELKGLCWKELPEYAQPVKYIILPEMPVTLIGKVDCRSLEKTLKDGLYTESQGIIVP